MRWGSLSCLHWGHTEYAGEASFQAAARRLRILALEVLRLGTAMSVSVLLCYDGLRRPGMPQLGQSGQGRMSPVLVAVARIGVEVGTAPGAQPGAGRATKGMQRKPEEDRVAHRGI